MPTPIVENGRFFTAFSGAQGLSTEMRACCREVVEVMSDLQAGQRPPVLLLGKVQSGKTRGFMGAISLGFDNGYDLVIILTKGTKLLARQTYRRIKKDFKEFDDQRLVKITQMKAVKGKVLNGHELKSKRIIVCMKEDTNVDDLIEYVSEKNPSLRAKRTMIVDDEADVGSVGYRKTKGGEIIPNKVQLLVNDLRKLFSDGGYLQVTATPYALHYQPGRIPLSDGSFMTLRPAVNVLLPIHQSYVGSDFYFSKSQEDGHYASLMHVPISKAELRRLNSKKPIRRYSPTDPFSSEKYSGLRGAILTFVAAAAFRYLQGESHEFSFLVHTSTNKTAHEKQMGILNDLNAGIKSALANGDESLDRLINVAIDDLLASVELGRDEVGKVVPERSAIYEQVIKALGEDDWLKFVKVNSDEDLESQSDEDTGELNLESVATVFVGGQILDRGITIPHMLGFFYGRLPQTFQQSTVMQHSRMYGARPSADMVVTRFYTEESIHEAMSNMHDCDELLWSDVKSEKLAGRRELRLLSNVRNVNVKPCSPSQIPHSRLLSVNPRKRFLPYGFQVDYNTRLEGVMEQIRASLLKLKVSFPSPEQVEEFNKSGSIIISLQDAFSLLDLCAKGMLWDEEKYEDLEFNWDDAKSLLTFMSNQAPEGQRGKVALITRWSQNLCRIAPRGNVRVNNAPDSKSVKTTYNLELKSIPTLVLVEQLGKMSTKLDEKGRPYVAESWRAGPFWWPVIWTQHDIAPVIFIQDGEVDAPDSDEDADADAEVD